MTSSRVSVCRSHASKLLTLTTYVLHTRDHTAVYRPDVRSMSVGLSCCAARDVYSPPLPGVPGARRTSVTVSDGHASDERRRWHLQVFGRRNGTEPI